ncbi:MAG: hypothetical protein KGL39_36975 [Patescibacteria group bacterium]|nr:hypothetical protein [Patescibacteria group bacterium]
MLPWEEAAQQQSPQPAQMMPWEEAAQAQAQSQGSLPLGQRIQNDWQQRAQAVKNAPDLPDFLISSARLGIGGAADVGNEAVKSAWNEIPGHGLVGDAAEWAKDKIASIPTMGGQATFGDVGNAALGAAQREAQAHPTLANAAGLAGDYGNLAALAGGASALREGVNAASDAATKSAAKDLTEGGLKPLNNPKNIFISKDEPNAVSKAIDEERQKAYIAAGQSGGARNATAVNGFLTQAANSPEFNPDKFTSASDKSAVNLINNLAQELHGQPMSIERAQALDQDLGTLKNAAFKKLDAPNQRLGYQYAAIQQALRDNVFNNPDASTFIGNPEAWNALQEGNRLHSQYMKAKTIENLYQNGAEKAVPSTSIQTQFGTLARKIRQAGKGQLGFTDEQVAAINRAAKSGKIEPTLRLMGSRLVGPLVGGMIGESGGPIGSILGMEGGNLAGATFRAGATALRTGKVNDVLRSVVNDPYYNMLKSSPITESAPEEIKALPSPTSAQPMTADQIAAARAQINKPPEPQFQPNLENVPRTTVRDPNTGLLEKAIKEPMGNAAQNEGYQKLQWTQQRQIDKLMPEYTNGNLSKAQVIRQMAKIGLSPKDANDIVENLYQAKIWRNNRIK